MKKESGITGKIIGSAIGGAVGAITPFPLLDDIIFAWIGSKIGDNLDNWVSSYLSENSSEDIQRELEEREAPQNSIDRIVNYLSSNSDNEDSAQEITASIETDLDEFSEDLEDTESEDLKQKKVEIEPIEYHNEPEILENQLVYDFGKSLGLPTDKEFKQVTDVLNEEGIEYEYGYNPYTKHTMFKFKSLDDLLKCHRIYKGLIIHNELSNNSDNRKAVQINSLTYKLSSTDHKKISSILEKIAKDNNISDVSSVCVEITKESGDIKFVTDNFLV